MLVLLIVAVAVHFAISGLALLFFGPEGFRTEPVSRAVFDIGGVTVSAQTALMVMAALAFLGLFGTSIFSAPSAARRFGPPPATGWARAWSASGRTAPAPLPTFWPRCWGAFRVR